MAVKAGTIMDKSRSVYDIGKDKWEHVGGRSDVEKAPEQVASMSTIIPMGSSSYLAVGGSNGTTYLVNINSIF